jgi:DNA-binding transcriptional LysR family regulator
MTLSFEVDEEARMVPFTRRWKKADNSYKLFTDESMVPDLQTLDWNLVRAFLAVVEAGSLTRAAERLDSSQPTLSRQIATLEQVLGTPLFERTARRLAPTAAGQTLATYAQRMRDTMRAAGAALALHSTALAGTVRLTASEVVAAYLLPDLLTGLAQRHPDLEVELVASNDVDNLLDREADIAVRMVRPSQGGVIARHVADWPLGVYTHLRYLEEVGGAIAVERLASYRWIGQDEDTQLIAGFRALGFDVNRNFFKLRCDNQIVTMQALLAGLGLAVAPAPVAARMEGLREIPLGLPMPQLPVWLTAHRELRSNARMRAVFDFLAVRLQEYHPAGDDGQVRRALPAPATRARRSAP